MRRGVVNGAVTMVLMGAVAVLLLAGRGGLLRAQVQSQGMPQLPGGPPGSVDPTLPSVPDTPYAARMKHQQQIAVMDDRRKKMVADAEKLLELATELKADVDKQAADETSVSAYTKADEIERLAHDVKQRLKN